MRSRVWRIGGATLNRRGGAVRTLMRGSNVVLCDLTSDSNDSISWIWHRPVPAWPMTWLATASGTARATVMQGLFMEGIWLIACWGQCVDAGVVQGFL